MKMKSILLVMLSLCLMIGLCACGGNAEDGSTTTATTTAATTVATTTTVPTTVATTTVADGKVTYTVTVIDEANNPVVGAMVQLCIDESINGIPAGCNPMMTNTNGVALLRLPETDWGVQVTMTPEGSGLSPVLEKLHFEDGSYEMTIVLKAVA